MNFQNARFASSLPPYREHSSNVNTIDLVSREPTVTPLEHVQAEILGLNNETDIYGVYSAVQEPFRRESRFSDHPSAVRNRAAMTNITGLEISQTGQDRTQSKHGVSKRFRTTFSAPQLNRLESEFCQSMYVVGLKRMRLAVELNLEEKQIKIWFQNRRMKHKRQLRNNERKTAQIPYYHCYQ